MSKLIAISLNPNIQRADIRRVLLAVPKFILGQLDDQITIVEEMFRSRFGQEYQVMSFLTGRAGWWAILSCLNLEQGDEVLIPAFTCVAVVNPIRWLGLTPVFVDVDNNFHLDLEDARQKTTAKTKVLLAQHTFGQPADMRAYQAFADEHNLTLIEDCAHALGGTFDGQVLGTFGAAAFFSFGRDKSISAGTGGMVIAKDPELAQRLRDIQRHQPTPSAWEAIQYILYILSIEALYVLYAVHPIVGKFFHKVLLATGFIKTANSPQEKQGQYDPHVLQQWHPILAWLAGRQLQVVDEFNAHRLQIAHVYTQQLSGTTFVLPTLVEGGVCLRYAILSESPDRLRQHAAQQHLVLGDWYDQPIGPRQVDLAGIGYESGSCPNAERLSRMVVNLPTSPRVSVEDAQRVVTFLRNT